MGWKIKTKNRPESRTQKACNEKPEGRNENVRGQLQDVGHLIKRFRKRG